MPNREMPREIQIDRIDYLRNNIRNNYSQILNLNMEMDILSRKELINPDEIQMVSSAMDSITESQSSLLGDIENWILELNSIINERNKNGITNIGFPLDGENIIYVGDSIDIEWNSALIGAINTFFIKGTEILPIVEFKHENENRKSFVISSEYFSDEYFPCKIRMQSVEIPTVFDETLVFKVLRNI